MGTYSPSISPCTLPSYYDEPVLTHWKLISTNEARLDKWSTRDNTDILVWQNGKKSVAATQVTLLIDASWQTLSPELSTLLKQEAFTLSHTSIPVAYLEKNWGQVLLSHNLDISVRLAQQFIAPELKQAREAGDITATEEEQKIQQSILQHELWIAPQDLLTLPELQSGLTLIEASKTYYAGKTERITYLKMMDVSQIFQQPKVAVTLTTCNKWPNPDYSYIKAIKRLADFNLISPVNRLASDLSDHIVPGEVINLLLDQLHKNNISSQLASDAIAWVKTTPLPDQLPELQPHQPDNLIQTIPSAPTSIEKISLKDLLPDAERLPKIVSWQELPEGNILFITQQYVIEQNATVAEIFMTTKGNRQQITRLWQGNSVPKLALSHHGKKAWFTVAPQQWFEIDIPTHKISALDAIQIERNGSLWFINTQDQPVVFYTDYSDEGKGCLVLKRVNSNASLAESVIFRTCRNKYVITNSIHPVLISTPGYFWFEDSNGLVKLKADTGIATLSYTVPPRFPGESVAPWSPAPLGSEQSHWIAVNYHHFSAKHGDIVGAYFIDTLDGKWRFSAEFGEARYIKAVARSAQGRFYAQGAYDDQLKSTRVDLWDTTHAIKITSIHISRICELNGLAFNWQGDILTLLCNNNQWLRFTLPNGLRDATTGDAMPMHAEY